MKADLRRRSVRPLQFPLLERRIPVLLGRAELHRTAILRALAHHPPVAVGGSALMLLALAALLAPWIAPCDPTAIDLRHALAGPSLAHPLGTDHLGRDVLSRLLFGGRYSLGAAVVAVVLATALGLAIGMPAGFYGGWLDEALMRIVDVLLALPTFILALVIAGMMGPGLWNVVVALVLVRWAGLARIVRGLVLSLREQPFVEAARAIGASDHRIMLLHIWPNLIGPLLAVVTLDLGTAILSIAGFGFLGLGVQMPQPEWGSLLNEARIYFQKAPHLMIYPGLCISLAVLSATLLGDGLRDTRDRQQDAGRRF
ncbi:MAG: nickel transporter permease [Anaerolineae bacterium]